MFHRIAIAILILLCAVPATAQIDPNTSTAVLSAPSCLMSCPAGDGNTFGASGVNVTFTIFDVTGLPVVGLSPRDFEIDGITPFRVADAFYPAGPAWDLQQAGFGVIAPGVYGFQGALTAGGNEPSRALGKVRGLTLVGAGSMPLTMVSPDMNGDGAVNLIDVTLFTSVFYGAYSFTADFNCDGAVNLIDVTFLATHIGHALPPGAIADPVD